LRDEGYCGSCEDDCRKCRSEYELDFSDHIAGVIDFPAVVPAIIDEPEPMLPDEVPDHDILVSIAVNEEILAAFIRKFPVAGGIVVPIERSNTISPYGVRHVQAIAEDLGIEIAFPKPFCSFDPEGGILAEFRDLFRIGKPAVAFSIEDNVITRAEVEVSSPCGATYFTARRLEGVSLDTDLEFEIDKSLSCFPCTADGSVDRQFGDSIIHRAAAIQQDILNGITEMKNAQ
jgi:hypothetical protein